MDGWGRPIEADTMRAAVKIGRYLIAHALAVFDFMGADPRLEAALRIGHWIVAGRHATFTKREAFRALRGQALFPTVERITAGLAALDEHGWVRQLAPGRGPGRPPSRYETNPAIFLEAWTKWPELIRSPDPDDVLSILSMDSEGRATAEPEPDSATREPELWAPGPIPPLEPAELRDWLAAPLREPDRAASDEWGAIG